ncbi:hypothetical protein A2643_03920 [Candidatus Nomurabacteria bacterium RIFCSPHIGHO2_01_FULL_39_220]|uniref:DUF6922 domain-containing protein n=1 Tax=Candidatus Nomurabacteria bacterium RIFCSPLOWO2_02_FULL_40_67 TaxID=1801787 RepID=A0A1F6Y5M4_9BACT|nr:MAG: hypothetical protein UU01_C0004G0037 [Parcubacteria group bacterium GW2011_GWA2_40_37]KKS11576.1 MAG: hypothetical protein UU66_C0014G0009 [Parcubacteria group bacterium GW2011_GWB1_41_5]KKS71348.1 MAG: hypothetical protein UV43_C0040G0018 [Parcubacteria group bacterium GW2011_GWF2_42_7]OGI62826.1 MAG: hypothetical protein A2W12_03490 [Candidatus Nomurabacteria bacterium RBG_16_40_11]OGI69753.1 MAG: hypothetical protein A2643_03920 [Candidatus Nomurabacteria bacterium RIFCSPHIGHO2_01_FU
MLPEIFRSILWSYNFEKCDPKKMKNTIITNAVNYGTFSHWRWIRSFYGSSVIEERLHKMPSSFRDSVFQLAEIFFSK